MIARMAGAAIRGFLVALLIATPALILPGSVTDSHQITVLVALLAAFMTFIEYNSSSPSIVEFRDAAPFNRIRFIALFISVLLLSMIAKGMEHLTLTTRAISTLATILGNVVDFPYSPVRLMVLILPDDATLEVVRNVRRAAGISYTTSLGALLAFVVVVRGYGWPTRNKPFNVWVNLPLFDPTAGGDVLLRLQRDARINIAVGFLLPFVIPAVIKLTSDIFGPITFDGHQTLIWTMCAWAFLPASIIMRGIAMHRVAELIEEQRRRVYANGSDGDENLRAA